MIAFKIVYLFIIIVAALLGDKKKESLQALPFYIVECAALILALHGLNKEKKFWLIPSMFYQVCLLVWTVDDEKFRFFLGDSMHAIRNRFHNCRDFYFCWANV